MKHLLALLLFLFSISALAVQKARIAEPEVEVYSAQDFDSDILDYVKQGETYLISNKVYGAFYKIKLKNGKVGYIVDYALDIEGKGPFKPKELDEPEEDVNKQSVKENPYLEESDDEESSLGRVYGGPSIAVINFQENALGSGQVDDLVAVGYKSVSLFSWSAMLAPMAPRYYSSLPGHSATGGKLWADIGYSSTLAYFNRSEIRFAGSFFTQISILQVETPLRKYDLHDITLGLALEGAVLLKVGRHAIDVALKYYFDKTNYAGLSLSYFF